MPKSGTAMTKASNSYLMAGRNLGSFCGIDAGEGIIVNHCEVFGVALRGLLARPLAGCDVAHTLAVPSMEL